MRVFYTLVDVSLRFTLLLGFVLNVYGKVYLHFLLLFCFKMWTCRSFIVRNHEISLNYVRASNEDTMGITSFKWFFKNMPQGLSINQV